MSSSRPPYRPFSELSFSRLFCAGDTADELDLPELSLALF